MLKRALIIFLLSLLSASSVFADEGFGEDIEKLPVVAKQNWYATVLIELSLHLKATDHAPTVDGHLTGIIMSETPNHEALILTDSHSLQCPTRYCSFRVRFHDKLDENKMLMSMRPMVIYDNPILDFTLIRVKIPENAKYSIATLAPSPDNDLRSQMPVLALGYPDLNLRAQSSHSPDLPTDMREVKKRYSVGTVLYYQKNRQFRPINRAIKENRPKGADPYVYVPAILHSADTLPGISGGPLMNGKGEIIGINVRSSTYTNEKKKSQHEGLLQESKLGLKFYYCIGEDTLCYNVATPISAVLRDLQSHTADLPISMDTLGSPALAALHQ